VTYGFLDIVSTPSVLAAQATNDSREQWEHFDGRRACDRFSAYEAAFIDARQLLHGNRFGVRLAIRAASRRPTRFG